MPYINHIKDNKYQIFFNLGRDSTGKPIRRSKTIEASSLKAAERKATKIELELRQQIQEKAQTTPTTYAELVFKWEEIKAPSLATTTYNRYKQILEKVLLPEFGDLLLKEITPLRIEEFISKYKAKASQKTISNYLKLLETHMNLAVKWELLAKNPCLKVEKPKNTPAKVDFYDEDEIKQLLEALETEKQLLQDQIDSSIKYKYHYSNSQKQLSIATRQLQNSMFELFILISLIAGTRLSETMGLEFSDFNHSTNAMIIQRTSHYDTAKHAVYTKDTLKNGDKQRLVYMPSHILELVSKLEEQQLTLKTLLKQANIEYVDSNRLFISTTKSIGEPMIPDTMKTGFRRFLEKHNLKKIRLHDLRHTSTSYLLNKGLDIPTAANRLGHNDIRITTQIYNHIYKDNKIKAGEMFNQLFI